jgi:hypothetical protein
MGLEGCGYLIDEFQCRGVQGVGQGNGDYHRNEQRSARNAFEGPGSGVV